MLQSTADNSVHGPASHDSVSGPAAVTPVAVKALNLEQGDNAELAEHEATVLASLSGKEYVPRFYGYYTDPDTQRWHRRAYILTGCVLPTHYSMEMNLQLVCNMLHTPVAAARCFTHTHNRQAC